MNRYEFDGHLVEMAQHENGEWVRYEDVRLEQSHQTEQAEASSLSVLLTERGVRMKRHVPCGKGNSEIGPPLAVMLVVVAVVSLICNYFGFDPFAP